MKTRELILAGLFAAITCVLSLIIIPFGPVPFTLQVFAVTLAGAITGAKIGFFSQLTYLLLGAIGLPVYSGMNGGIGHLVGPTGGYIIGFVLAALFIGVVTDYVFVNIRNIKVAYLLQFLGMMLGVIIIYFAGMLQLKLVLNLTYIQAFNGGVVPFILPDIIKVIGAFIVSIPIRNALKKEQLI